MVLGRSTMVVGRSIMLLGRPAMVFGRSTTVLGRSTMMLGRSTMMLGRSTMVLGMSTMVLGRSTMHSPHKSRFQTGIAGRQYSPANYHCTTFTPAILARAGGFWNSTSIRHFHPPISWGVLLIQGFCNIDEIFHSLNTELTAAVVYPEQLSHPLDPGQKPKTVLRCTQSVEQLE